MERFREQTQSDAIRVDLEFPIRSVLICTLLPPALLMRT